MVNSTSSLLDIVETLARQYTPPPLPSDPFQLILWENIGYLIDDQRRRGLFADFAERVGFDPRALLDADDDQLFSLAERGGMRPDVRVERWRTIAKLTLEVGGDFRAALAALPLTRARSLLKRYPTIGDPGADKVLLFSGVAARPCLESNGLRAICRLGLVEEQSSYDRTYKLAMAVMERDGRIEFEWLRCAWLVLREHGKALCRRGELQCAPCPLEDRCPKAKVVAF